MRLPKGFNSDYPEWLETSFTHTAVLECFPIIMRTMLMEDIVSYEDLIEALPEDADIAETLGMNVYGLPDQTTYVSECPNHQSRQEHYLSYLNGLQLMWRIDEKHPEAVGDSPRLAMLLLYNAIQEAREQKRKGDQWERRQKEDDQ